MSSATPDSHASGQMSCLKQNIYIFELNCSLIVGVLVLKDYTVYKTEILMKNYKLLFTFATKNTKIERLVNHPYINIIKAISYLFYFF